MTYLIAMAAPGQGPGGLWQFLPFALILGIFYFLILLPMKRRQKKVEEFQQSLKVGDKIAPAGLYGSDHDMFAFMVLENRRIEDGTEGGLSRGAFFSNSEVGGGAFRIKSFYYRHVCGNHIVWGNTLIGLLDGDHIVWGNAADQEHLVWGNLDAEHLVWGNNDLSDADDVVVETTEEVPLEP